MHRRQATWVVALLIAVGCSGSSTAPSKPTSPTNGAEPVKVRLAVAANMEFAMPDLIKEFSSRNPGIEVEPVFGSSGNFYTQLVNKAPFDMFFSAETQFPHQLVEQSLADGKSFFVYGVGQIVVWIRKDSKLDVENLGLKALLDPDVKKIAIANPQHAPFGHAAVEAMKKLGIYDQVQDRLVLGENIAQAAQFVDTGAADIGVIALSLAMAPAMKENGRYGTVPQDAYVKMEQAAVIMSSSGHREAAEAFGQFVMGADGRKILGRFGFTRPAE